jgi:8-oxo-dGTP pyrophosphatase MutT (NUDIX family)
LPALPRSAATVVLLREGPRAAEVLLVRRHGASGFMAGATVFPGGKLDAADLQVPAVGRTAADCAALLGLDDAGQARAFFVAAVREMHEEAHVLLAADAGGRLADAEALDRIDARLAAVRDGHRLAAGAWHAAVAAEGLQLRLDLLTPFAHWLTPKVEPRRFNTYFLAGRLPAGQVARLDGHETTAAFWRTPADALAEHAAGGAVLLPPPTLHTLDRLHRLGTDVELVLAALATEGVGPCIEPAFLADSPVGPTIVMPEDPLHPEGARWRAEHGGEPCVHRFVLTGGRFDRVYAPLR